MKSSINNLAKSQVEIKVTLDNKEFQEYIEKITKQIGEGLEVKGFRKGQAPKEVVQEKAGIEKILSEAAEEAVKEKYIQIIKEKKLEPVTQPEVEVLKLAKDNDFEFKITTTVLPEVELPDYKKIASKIKKVEVTVSDQDVEDALNWLQKSRAKFTSLDRPAQKGDFVEIKYESPEINKSKPIKDGFIIEKGHFIPGFEDNVVGMKKEEEKEFSLSFPEDFKRKDLAGKKADFKVKMIDVKKMELPELNDKFASDLGGFDNLDSLKKNVKEGLTKEKEIGEKQKQRSEILENIAKDAKAEIPEKLIEKEKNNLFEDFKRNIEEKTKTSFEKYLESINKNEEEIEKSFVSEAEKRIKFFLILKEIGKKEEVEVAEKEIEEKTNENLGRYPEEEKNKVDFARLKEYTRETIYNEKVFKKLEGFID